MTLRDIIARLLASPTRFTRIERFAIECLVAHVAPRVLDSVIRETRTEAAPETQVSPSDADVIEPRMSTRWTGRQS